MKFWRTCSGPALWSMGRSRIIDFGMQNSHTTTLIKLAWRCLRLNFCMAEHVGHRYSGMRPVRAKCLGQMCWKMWRSRYRSFVGISRLHNHGRNTMPTIEEEILHSRSVILCTWRFHLWEGFIISRWTVSCHCGTLDLSMSLTTEEKSPINWNCHCNLPMCMMCFKSLSERNVWECLRNSCQLKS
jgi:hypothetical protein